MLVLIKNECNLTKYFFPIPAWSKEKNEQPDNVLELYTYVFICIQKSKYIQWILAATRHAKINTLWKCLKMKQRTRQSRRYAENPLDTAVFRGRRPSGSFFRKNKKKPLLDKVYGSMCTKCVLNFRSVSLFVWPGGVTQINSQINKDIHTYKSEIRNILDRLLASSGFW